VDSSAVLSIVLQEPDSGTMLLKLKQASKIWMSPVNLWEVYVRARTLGGSKGEDLASEIIAKMGIEIAEIRAEEAMLAMAASKRFAGRPARLNMGDCFAYALAKQKDLPLLFKGNDFAATDVKVA
jgi:ribonuclease VapC